MSNNGRWVTSIKEGVLWSWDGLAMILLPGRMLVGLGNHKSKVGGRGLAMREAVIFHQGFANRGMRAWMIRRYVAGAHL
ncbi:hypothetical protein DBR07_15710 [Aeromonas sp. HMWF036]|nr:hypothetical protein DBR07_15710 [Aeromonas sp. HMWF036]PTT27276.1 hypothetical protein DBR30_11355 [Aeromonas sp. HMWF017]PTT57597.1 hypothetical protein DBR13_02145 [Aeromonas sp. HMWF015]